MALGRSHVHISVNCTGILCRDAPGHPGPQGDPIMTKKLALAASMVMLMTFSGQAFAKTAAPSDRQAAYAFNALDRAVATDTDATNAHPYHGGPKYND
jgi:hypothetical protein